MEEEKKLERNAFLFITVFLAPILASIIVFGWGFFIWISQMIMGPPGS